MSRKALPFCCASTVCLSEAVPFRAVPLSQAPVAADAIGPARAALPLGRGRLGLARGRDRRPQPPAPRAGPHSLAPVAPGRPRPRGGVSSKALSFCCASTVLLSKTAPFHAVPLSQVEADGGQRQAALRRRAGPRAPGRPGEATVLSFKGSDHCLSFCFSAFPCGPTALTSDTCCNGQSAQNLPAALRLFGDATSLGGVESLVEWRRKYDDQVR
eukprot:SAG22_NODE_1_length_62449_cov_158.689270_12_plen_214_part_00